MPIMLIMCVVNLLRFVYGVFGVIEIENAVVLWPHLTVKRERYEYVMHPDFTPALCVALWYQNESIKSRFVT